MEVLLILGGLFILYSSGALTSFGFAPSGPIFQDPSTALSNQIAAEEAAAASASPNQTGASSGALTGAGILSAAGSGISAGAAVGGPVGAAVGAGVALMQSITSIFNGMKLRAQQAQVENVALNYAVQAFDQTLRQVNAAYLNRQISPQEALVLVQQIYQQFWTVTATKIQPNRNGCQSGVGCPDYVAGDPLMASGVGTTYCAGTIGATCCVGCGRIRQAVYNVLGAIQNNGGVSNIPAVIGDRYGLQTRPAYNLSW